VGISAEIKNLPFRKAKLADGKKDHKNITIVFSSAGKLSFYGNLLSLDNAYIIP